MNHQLKADIDKLIVRCGENVNSGPELIKREFLNYISYLSSSDGIIAEEETTFLQQYLHENLSPAELSQYMDLLTKWRINPLYGTITTGRDAA